MRMYTFATKNCLNQDVHDLRTTLPNPNFPINPTKSKSTVEK